MAFKQYLILHNEDDGASRYFVAGQYDPEQHDVIDWYRDTEKRTEYEALGLPSPSAFPTVVDTTTGKAARLPENMKTAIAILSGKPTLEEQVQGLTNQLTAAHEQIELLNQTVQEIISGGV